MHRRKFLQSTATLGATVGLTLAAPPFIARAATKELLVAEPVHSTGYLPMYIAMANNYFAESDIAVKIVTIETGSGHTNAVLSGQAFAFIGGPEHNAFAKAKGAELRAVVHCVDRGNVYLCAAKGQDPKDRDWSAYMKGKTIAVGPYGGTPNSIMRYLLGKWKLDAKRDVTLIESAKLRRPRRRPGRTGRDRQQHRTDDHAGYSQRPMERAVLQRPEGAWSLRLFHHQCPSGFHPEGARGGAWLRQGNGEGPEIPLRQPARVRRSRQEAIPDHAARRPQGDARPLVQGRDVEQGRHDQQGSLGRPAAPWCVEAGILKTDVKYEEIIDMSFVESVRASL